MSTKNRCAWATNERLIRYHDVDWGVPVHDDQSLFEFLVLEGAQAGLSWDTILRKREAYRVAFADFDPDVVARFRDTDIERLLKNPGIVRNRLKVTGAIKNARAFLGIREEFGSFDTFIWQFIEYKPKVNTWHRMEEIPTETFESKAMSRALKRRGFTFVGQTICYAFMQAVGMVNDHTMDCFRHAELDRPDVEPDIGIGGEDDGLVALD